MIENPHAYNCSTCSISVQNDILYKDHFKSEFHRYNIKRRLINLPAATHTQFEAQFEQSTNKSASEPELRCEICSKTFLSANTYRHHINSAKHKKNREHLLKKEADKGMKKSKSASSSEFSVLSCDSEIKHDICIFCRKMSSQQHLQEHNFPPFKESCIDLKGLIAKVTEIIKSGHCIYCSAHFENPEATKQHMEDVGHCMLNTAGHFEEFSSFYVCSIQQEPDSGSEEEESVEELKKIPPNKIQDYYSRRIVPTTSGAKIRGKRQVGVRRYKRYYKQYYREITRIDRSPFLALTNAPETALHTLHSSANSVLMNFPKRINIHSTRKIR